MASFLTRILSLNYHIVEPDSSIAAQPSLQDWIPMDQRATSLGLITYRDAQGGFYKYPQNYFGSYYPIEESYKQGRYEEWAENEDDIRGQLHLGGTRKDEWDWEAALHYAEDVYAEAAILAQERGIEGNGLELMPIVEQVKAEMEKWWDEALPGIEGVHFSEY